jgi:hypothetical protein
LLLIGWQTDKEGISMAKHTEFEEHDKACMERLSKHIDFPNNEDSLKLFKQYRNKIFKRQMAADNKRFRTKEFLETSYRKVEQAIPDLDLTTPAGAILFVKSVLGVVLEITAYRAASMSFMLQIYENQMKQGPRNKSKPNLKLIK